MLYFILICFSLSNTNELSLKICLICFNIEKKLYLKNNDDGNWMNQTTFETMKRALHSNDENVCVAKNFYFINLLKSKNYQKCFIDPLYGCKSNFGLSKKNSIIH